MEERVVEVTRWPKWLEGEARSHSNIRRFRVENRKELKPRVDKTLVCILCEDLRDIDARRMLKETLDSLGDEYSVLVFTSSLNEDGTVNEDDIIVLSSSMQHIIEPEKKEGVEEGNDVSQEGGEGVPEGTIAAREMQEVEEIEKTKRVLEEALQHATSREMQEVEEIEETKQVSEASLQRTVVATAREIQEESREEEEASRFKVSDSIASSLEEKTLLSPHVRFFSSGENDGNDTPDWLVFPDPIEGHRVGDERTNIVYKGQTMMILKGRIPPDLLISLARQRVNLPTENHPVPLYFQGESLRVGSYVVDAHTYSSGVYVAYERTRRPGMGSLRRSNYGVGGIVQAHRQRRAASESW